MAEDTKSKTSGSEGSVTIISGAQHYTNVTPGQSVRDIKKICGDMYSIDANSRAMVNGMPVDDDHVLKGGETVEFVSRPGQKG